MRVRTTAIGAVLLLGTLTACSEAEPSVKPGHDLPTPRPAPPSASSPDPSGPQPKALGVGWTWSSDLGQQLTATATSYTQPTPHLDAPDASTGAAPGSVWAQVEGKLCSARGDPLRATQYTWRLEYADGTSVNVTGLTGLTGGDFPRPEYPMNRTVHPGKCAGGKIQFPVPGDKWPARIVYSPEQPGAYPDRSWTVPPK